MSERNDAGQAGTRGDSQTITHHCDWTETTATLAVVEAVSVAANRNPLDHAPLYEAIDTDALNDVFDPTDGSPAPGLDVSFTYEGFEVTVSGTGAVTVRPLPGATFPA